MLHDRNRFKRKLRVKHRLHMFGKRLEQNMSPLAWRWYFSNGRGGTRTQHLDWLCQRSRPAHRRDKRRTQLILDPVLAEQWKDCLPATVTAMSNQWQTLKDQINAMTPSGNTNQAVGLAWGWQSVSTTNGPIVAPGKGTNSIYKDYIVLLSDGLNTQNRWSTTQSSIDARQELLCQNIRTDTTNPVTVFTIQVNINNADPKSQVLQDCATNGNFQMITDSTQTSDAFNNVFTQISKLRVLK
jgi:hypothetical protein